MAGVAFGYEKRQGNEGVVVYRRLAIRPVQRAVLRKEQYKKERSNTLVAVYERMVLDDEIEQVSSFRFDTLIKRPAPKCPIERTQNVCLRGTPRI